MSHGCAPNHLEGHQRRVTAGQFGRAISSSVHLVTHNWDKNSKVSPMKPGEHPEFYRFPAPEGRSRESTITLDKQGRFFHEGQLVERPRMAQAFASWLRRHPDNGRYILSNEYDWTYLTVEDAPFFVRSLRIDDDSVTLRLSDGSEEPLRKEGLRVGADDALYCGVKNGEYEARFTPAAQLMLEPLLEAGTDEKVCIRLGGELVSVE